LTQFFLGPPSSTSMSAFAISYLLQPTMSEKTPLQLEEAAPVQSSPTSQAKERRRARLYKAVCFYFAWVMANSMHKFALAHADESELANWNGLIAPVNRWLSPWFIMFSVREIRAPQSRSSRTSSADLVDIGTTGRTKSTGTPGHHGFLPRRYLLVLRLRKILL
jgi:hypothetical protein